MSLDRLWPARHFEVPYLTFRLSNVALLMPYRRRTLDYEAQVASAREREVPMPGREHFIRV